ncbi:hypothetical protein KDW_62190 [Dictyobacter vulcani]|uniref:Chitin-binding type-3 domain-containing protein n=1 Tax=Dictyobacter vulcani TaxID=2607529 RepID=A0A5J4KZX1_9CHLR|nr:hypothetical protein [Dictyobacter vulcani]GER92057.1 hypothetical protein KDW_62190 [Dictyobacter vulcani]
MISVPKKLRLLIASLLLTMVLFTSVFFSNSTAQAATKPSKSPIPNTVCDGPTNSYDYGGGVLDNLGIDRVNTSAEYYYNNTTQTTVSKSWSTTITANASVTVGGQ